MPLSPIRSVLTAQVDQAFRGPAWHGPSLWPTLKKLKASEAEAPSPFEGYTAWGIALHTGYWKYRGLLLLAKASEGAIALPERYFRQPSDWPAMPEQRDGVHWVNDLEQIERLHERWKTALQAFPDHAWNMAVRGDGTTAAELVLGVASHDLYHTAQIRNMGVKRY